MVATLHLSPGQNFDCSLCSKCCRGWTIRVNAKSAARIRGSALELRVIEATGSGALVRRGGQTLTAQRSEGSCVFLDDRQLCSVHNDLGEPAKPSGCRQFPFRLCRTPDGVFAGVSFYCSAAQRNEGRPLLEHSASLLEMASEAIEVGSQPLPVDGDVTMTWAAYRVLDDFLQVEVPPIATSFAALAGMVKQAEVLQAPEVDMALQNAVAFHPRPAQRFFLVDLLARLEATSRDQLPALSSLLLADQPVTFRRFGPWTGKLSQIEATSLPCWAEHELHRYLKELVFRKFLVTRGLILHNLALLCLLPTLFHWCAGLNQLGRGGSLLEPVDVYRAFDECEYRFVTHASGLDRFCASLARSLTR